MFGEIAAEEAIKYSSTIKHIELDPSSLKEEEKRLQNIIDINKNGAISVQEFEYKVRRKISDYAIPPKNETKLNQMLWWIQRFRAEVSDIKISDYHELSKFEEIRFILDCAELSVRASLTRKESRWGWFHYRIDFPKRDDEKWLKHVILEKNKTNGEMKVSLRDIKDRWK